MSSQRNVANLADVKDDFKANENTQKPVVVNESVSSLHFEAQAEAQGKKTMNAIHINFPRPTLISSMLSKLSKVFKYTFVMEPKLDRRVQVFSPGPVESEEAFKIFAASLGAVGLRVIFINSSTIKIAEKPSLKTHI